MSDRVRRFKTRMHIEREFKTMKQSTDSPRAIVFADLKLACALCRHRPLRTPNLWKCKTAHNLLGPKHRHMVLRMCVQASASSTVSVKHAEYSKQNRTNLSSSISIIRCCVTDSGSFRFNRTMNAEPLNFGWHLRFEAGLLGAVSKVGRNTVDLEEFHFQR